MSKTIKNLMLLTLLASLAACGGGDDVGGGATSAVDDTTEPEEETVPDPIDDEVVIRNLGLGHGTGATYVDGEILTSLSANETLSANGSTSITVDIVDLDDSNAHYLGVQNVFFLSTCSQVGLAEFSPAELEASATASSTYKDKGCGKEIGATDNIVVYIGQKTDTDTIDVVATARGTVDIAAAKVGAVQFTEASVDTIALSGFGTADAPALSEIEFQVIDDSGNSMPDRTVRFELDNPLGGASLSLSMAITDQDGKVKTILNSGNVSGAVRIKAMVDIRDSAGAIVETISTLSTPIAMATSIADQNSSSISLDSYNPSGWNRDGERVSVTVHLGDHYQNPVIDGTTVYFRTSGGLIAPSCVTTDGSCSVNWTSANPRPVDGIATIVAYTRGAGNYQDVNSNGLFDIGEHYESFGESYIDVNGDGSYSTTGEYQSDVDIDDDGTNDFLWANDAYQVIVGVDGAGDPVSGSSNFFEEFIDSNNNNSFDQAASGKYQGVNCSEEAIAAGHCAEQVDIVLSTRLQMSSSVDAFIEGPYRFDTATNRFDTSSEVECVDASSNPHLIGWRISDSDIRRNKLPQESQIGFELTDVSVISSTGNGLVISQSPVDTFSMWRAKRGLARNAQTKYDYLADRGHIVAANILRPESFSSVDGVGKIQAKVTTTSGVVVVAENTLEVDLLGPQVNLSSQTRGSIGTTINVSDGPQDFVLTIKNHCSESLEEGDLVISAVNGIISADSGLGAVSGTNIADNALTAIISNSDAPIFLSFTLTPDGTSSSEVGGLDITLRVPDPVYPFDNFIPIQSYTLND